MQQTNLIVLSLLVLSLISCNGDSNGADGYGNFEATEIIISAENNGKLMSFNVQEGNVIKKEAFIGFIDTIPLTIKREELYTSKEIISSKSKGVLSEISVLKAKLKTARINEVRTEKLIQDNAGTQQQLDDIIGEINVLNQQIRSIEIQNASTLNELKSIDVQLKQVDDQISKSRIVNPIEGTVLVTYAEQGEVFSFGKPLYKIADLNNMQLRAYISETQLSTISIGEEVIVKVDSDDSMRSYTGHISWIASEAEFTPKIIQTKEERVALVYAIKVDVVNDGGLKIGMPAEVWLKNSTDNIH
ncbi:HlyD family efflux transporter periplasmic adaptor subunit [Maribacter sp. D37]|nr:HlyD family efflux transporter periplasmic adaptor subunit [Maribacter polysaccharolyticus]MDE3741137.1 HlyD family efflux transporter periplasmic adaptor subunit [Maribacter polysaccharolyticus]